MLQGVKLSQTQCPTTAEDREKMKVIGSIMYAMLCTKPDVCLDNSLAGRYQSNPGVDHWTAVRNIKPSFRAWRNGFIHDLTLLSHRIKQKHKEALLKWIDFYPLEGGLLLFSICIFVFIRISPLV